MLKGAQKQMIVVRTRDSRLFEEAYFVMRRDAEVGGAAEPDMIREANRIIESSLPRGRREGSGRSTGAVACRLVGLITGCVCFAAGLLLGGGGVGLLWLLL